jgi:hypothetical protein
MKSTSLRVARPTDHLTELVQQYMDGLGFQILGSFEAHDGFDGVMLGHAGQSWHLEFTTKAGHAVGHAPTKDNLLVFYTADENEHSICCKRMRAAGFDAVPSFNPYWDRVGETFEDVDGYRVVLVQGTWPPA